MAEPVPVPDKNNLIITGIHPVTGESYTDVFEVTHATEEGDVVLLAEDILTHDKFKITIKEVN